MAISEPERHDLYQGMVEALGQKRAETFMNLVTTVPWSEVATKADVANLRAEVKSDVAGLQSALRGQLRAFVTIVAVLDGVLFAAIKLI